jgi:hypothetical protein
MADRLYKGPFNEDMRLIDGETATGVFRARWEEKP